MLFHNITIRLLRSEDFPSDAKTTAAADLTTAASSGHLSIPIAEPFPLADAAAAHDQVDTNNRKRELLKLTE